ncbi:hypothetical protein [Mesorhizobium sp. WSM2239]|uniref:DUF3618 domain-containing protein n=2 Tax=unclassified Mesorhizobium TaxID=325217 RepID=A0AAU8DAR3_9HYPH
MMDKSAAELEREAEAARARVANTAETLRSKMTPGQMIDEITGMFAGGDGSAALNNLKAQVRDNPLPLTLVGAGLAWLMFGQGASSSRHAEARYGMGEYGAREGWNGDYPSSDADLGDYSSAGRGGGSIADKAAGAASSAMEMASEAAGSVGQTLAGAGESIAGSARGVAGGARSFADRSRGMGAQARHAAEDMFEREPLVLAALGLTLGTAIGAMLPHTRLEDETLGKYGRKLRHAGEDLYEKGMDEAKDVAAEAYGAAQKEADRQGLTGDDKTTVADRVGEVFKSAAERTEETVRDKMGSQQER